MMSSPRAKDRQTTCRVQYVKYIQSSSSLPNIYYCTAFSKEILNLGKSWNGSCACNRGIP